MATDVVARLRLRAENFSREVRKAFDEVPEQADRAGRDAGQRMGAGIGAGLKSAVSAAAVVAVVNEIAQLTSRAVDFGVELGNNARALNTNVEELQAYREAASDVNVVHDKLDGGLQELLNTMVKVEGGDKDLTRAFKELGVSLRDTDGFAKTSTAVMGEVIDQLRRIPDPLRQAQYGAEIFGDKWRDIAPLLDAGSDGLQRLTQDILGTGDALSTKEIQELERINSEFERMKNALEVDVSRSVAANADAIITLGRAFNYMAGEAISALAAVVNLYRGLNANGTYAGSNAAAEENHRIRTANRGDEAYDPDAWFQVRRTGNRGTLRPRDSRRPDSGMVRINLPKGGKGGGGGIGNWRDEPAPAPVTTPLSAARLGGGGSAGKPKKSGGGGGMSKEAREAEQAAKRVRAEYERIGDSLDKDIEKQRISAEVEAIRAMGLEREAEKHEAINEIAARYPKLVGKTAEQLSKEFGISIEDAETRLKQLEQLRLNAMLEVDIKFDQKEAEEAAKKNAEIFKRELEAQGQLREQQRREEEERQRQTFEDLSGVFYDLFDGNTRNIWDNFKRLGLQALAQLAANQTMKLLNGEKVDIGGGLKELFSSQQGDVLGGMQKGALASSIADAIGIKQSKTGAMIGSAVGSVLPIPFGGAIGGFVGGTIGGFFKKSKWGTAALTGGADPSVAGNKATLRASAGGAAGSVQDTLAMIANQLGGDLGNYNVSIGQYKDKWRVSTSGYTGKLKAGKNGVVDFGKDGEEEAVRYAIRDALADGAIKGISDAAQRILKSGQDIEVALEKAASIEAIPKLLRARLDPLGAALDEIDTKFAKLAETLREGGGSAEQIAQARQLWELERADAIAEIGQASSVLRDYLKTLRIGADSPLSLRTQATEAEAAMAPYVAQINAAEAAKAKYDQLVASKAGGGSVSDADLKAAKDAATAAAAAIDQNGFRDSAALFLDVSRQLGGSTKSFFDQFDRIQGLTNSAIALVENAVPLRGDTKDPFAELTAKATQNMANILDGHTALLQQIANGLGGIGYGGGGGDVFIGGGRLFVNALR